MPFIDLANVRMFYTDDPARDATAATENLPILLVHGWACDSEDWMHQFEALTAGHRVIAPDLRGHGHSSVPDAGYTPSHYAGDLAELLTRLGVGPVVVVGHSFGSIASSTLAIEHPDLIAALVVIDPPYGLDAAGAADGLEFVRALTDGDTPAVAAARFDGAEAPDTPAHLVVWHRRRALGTSPVPLLETARAVHGSPDTVANLPLTEAFLAARELPVLAVHAHDVRAEWEKPFLTVPGSRAVGFGGAGHWLHQERPDEFNTLLLEWIEGLR